MSDEPPPCRFCSGTGIQHGQECGECCGLGVDCIDWYEAILYERSRNAAWADPSEALVEVAAQAIYAGWWEDAESQDDSARWENLDADDPDRESAVKAARHALIAVAASVGGTTEGPERK